LTGRDIFPWRQAGFGGAEPDGLAGFGNGNESALLGGGFVLYWFGKGGSWCMRACVVF
jgi:hypothetical protein